MLYIPTTVKNSLKLQNVLPSSTGLSILQSTGTLSINSGVTAINTPIFNLVQEWDDDTVTFCGFKINITDTASSGNSNIIDLQVGGVSRFLVYKDGNVNVGGILNIANGSASIRSLASNRLDIISGVNPQIFNIYNTYTGESNYERIKIGFSGNTAQLLMETVGGTARPFRIGCSGSSAIHFQTSGTDRWQISTGGALVGYADNTYDIGYTATYRPRSIYVGTSLNVSNGTIAASTPGLNISQTWNNAGVTFVSALIDITNTASASGSYLLQAKVGGVTRGYIDRDGNIGCTGMMVSTNNVNYGYYKVGNLTYIYADAANQLDIRNTTNAQRFNLYNTYTSGSNYECVSLEFVSNLARLFTNAQTGTQRNLAIGGTNLQLWSGSTLTQRWNIDSSGHFVANTDNAIDIGASGATRPRNIYVGTGIVAPKVSYGTPSTLTISGVAVTVTKSFHRIETAGGAATDDLEQIDGGSVGDRLILCAASDSHTVNILHGAGNIILSGGVDFALNNVYDTVELIFDGAQWLELSRSDNGA